MLTSVISICRRHRIGNRLPLRYRKKVGELILAKARAGKINKSEEEKENCNAAIHAVGSQQIVEPGNFHTLAIFQASTDKINGSISNSRELAAQSISANEV
jgi:hypothetical protein